MHHKVFTKTSGQCWTLHSWHCIFPTIHNDLPDVICNIVIYVDDTTLYSECDQTSDLLQQLRLASELTFDQQDTSDWGKK